MLYRYSKTTKKNRVLLVPIIPLLLVAILFLADVQMPRFLTNAAHGLATPLWVARDNVAGSFDGTVTSLESKRSLLQKNQQLEEELAALRREQHMAQILTQENERLRTLLGRVEDDAHLIPVSILNNAAFSPYDTFVIDLGVDDGVRPDMLVLSPEGTALGSVTKVLSSTSIVTRFSAPSQTFDAVLQASTTQHISLSGLGSGTMRASLPRDVEVREGDTVVLPSFTVAPIGLVKKIVAAPEDAYKILFIESPINIYQLRFVLLDTTHVWQVPKLDETDTGSET